MREFKWSRSCRWAVAVISATVLACGWGRAQQQGEPPSLVLNPIQTILSAHHAWESVPSSFRIAGTSTRGKLTEPVAITVTRQQEVLVEYGAKKRVATPTRGFEDEGGAKVKFSSLPPGFSQLDLASVFFLRQLTDRAYQAGLPESLKSGDASITRLHVRGERFEIHYRKYKVYDEFDLYIDPSGVLLGIDRTFYPEDDRARHINGWRFSDYRAGQQDGMLLPYRLDRYERGEPVETIQVESYGADAPAGPEMFKPRRTK